MKFLACGDTHVTDKKPRNRKDENYLNTVIDKMTFVFDYAENHNVHSILYPGDVFDTPKVPHKVVDRVIDTLTSKFNPGFPRVYAVHGQHDVYYHRNDLFNTPLGVLITAGIVKLLGSNPEELVDAKGNSVHLYGAGWNEDIPDIKDSDAFNVLLTHRMVIHQDKIWNEQEDFEQAAVLLKQNKFNLIVSGDNHHSFVCHYRNRVLVNCGSLMRSTVAQYNHKPCCYLYETDTKTASRIQIPYRPAEEVIDLEASEKQKKVDETTVAFITSLKELEDVDLDFEANVKEAINQNELEQPVIDVLKEVIGSM